MKEATGELNLTLIVVIAVGLLIAFFYYAIWPALDKNLSANSKCNVAICELPESCKKKGGKKTNNTCSEVIGQLVKCHYGSNKDEIYCPWKG